MHRIHSGPVALTIRQMHPRQRGKDSHGAPVLQLSPYAPAVAPSHSQAHDFAMLASQVPLSPLHPNPPLQLEEQLVQKHVQMMFLSPCGQLYLKHVATLIERATSRRTSDVSFQPRNCARLRELVSDRRFYRSKYDCIRPFHRDRVPNA